MRTVLVVLCLGFSACTSLKPVDQADLAPQRDPGPVLVLPRTGDPVRLAQPAVVGDSIVGRVDGARRAYALDDLHSIRQRRADRGKTLRTAAKAAGGLAAAAVAALAAVAWFLAQLLPG